MDSHSLVDWIAFTVPIRHELSLNSYNIQGGAHRALEAYLGGLWDKLVLLSGADEWELRNGRSPYSNSYYNGHGMTVFVGLRAENVLVEFTGAGCDWLREGGLMSSVFHKAHSRMSRIDIATDLKCNTRPQEFIEAGYSSTFKTSGHVDSSTGETRYIGSKKSERYCRVYRYHPPHERSHLLRIEYVFRKGASKKIADKLRETDVRIVAEGAANLYKWEHNHMEGKLRKMDLKAYRPDRKSGKTLLWLTGQVAPAFKKLVESGAISNPEEFLKKHFLETEKNDEN